ncbi:single-stranded DNA-binding protein [Planotetraspora kaengkrachanensis]|uniref:Single-stranded DNA-binding protein n=1 Tax=Planotetraspora kaengkrachanensis TaxID=575193 RepID=A0A8J3PXF4_9ACTN|nr:single-stranded DNA-binding protein [Planotetraspora kaengkrachanensis]GIG82921.1 hypothetical protein Pka01_60480 [Planotetraspora kaengkrachanensis]
MHRNEVTLVGRLSMEPVDRELPSGALLTQWRLAVRRPDDHPGRQRSDAIECATFDEEVRHMVADWLVDDVIEVQGALRRRWWRGGSRYEVEVWTARRVAREPDGSGGGTDQSKRVVQSAAQPKGVDRRERGDQPERADHHEHVGQHGKPVQADQDGETVPAGRDDVPVQAQQHERGRPDTEAGPIKWHGLLMRGRRDGHVGPATPADPGDGQPGDARGPRRRPVISLRRPRPAPAAPHGSRDVYAATDPEDGHGAPGGDDAPG